MSLNKAQAMKAALDGKRIRHSGWPPAGFVRWDSERGLFRDETGEIFRLDDCRTLTGWEVVHNEEQELLDQALNQLQGISVFLGSDVGFSAIGRYLAHRQMKLADEVAR